MQLPACAVCVLRLSWCGFAANGWWRWWWARQGLLCRDFLFELSPSSLCVSCRLSCFGIIDVVGVLFNVLCVRICACACVCVCVCVCVCLRCKCLFLHVCMSVSDFVIGRFVHVHVCVCGVSLARRVSVFCLAHVFCAGYFVCCVNMCC